MFNLCTEKKVSKIFDGKIILILTAIYRSYYSKQVNAKAETVCVGLIVASFRLSKINLFTFYNVHTADMVVFL